MKTLTNLCRIL